MDRIINKARDFLLKQNICSFETDVTNLKFDKKVIFDTFQNYAKKTGLPIAIFKQIKDGCTIIWNEVYIILTHELAAINAYRSGYGNLYSSPLKRCNWTLAHEVGHIQLGHMKDCEREESEANCFASELLIPELVILELQRNRNEKMSVNEVSRLFGVSQKAAEVRLKQINKKQFFSAYRQKEFMEKYSKLIYNYKEKYVKN